MPSWIATHADLMLSGLSPAACVPDARETQGVDATTGIWELDGHGFAGGESVRFVALPGNVLPTGINRLTYYAVMPPPSPDFFTLSPPLIPGDAGTGTISLVENVYPKIDAIMAQWTSMLIASAKAYKPPWFIPPTWAAMMVAKLAAPTVASVLRVPTARYDVALVERGFMWAEARRERLENGEPMDDGAGPIDVDPLVSDIGAISANDSTAAPGGATLWRTGTL